MLFNLASPDFSYMTAWKVSLLAAQWLLLSTQSIQPIVEGAQLPKYPQQPMAIQELMLPPKEFDHPYEGDVEINYLNEKAIQVQCWPARRTSTMLLACTRALTPTRCIIWIMAKDDLDRLGWSYDIIMRHEIAHCNGWKHSTAQAADWDWTVRPDEKPHQWPSYVQAHYLPPKEFDHEYDGKLTIKYVIFEDIYAKCRGSVTTGGAIATRPLACTQRNYDGPNTCAIWMLTMPAYARLGWDYNIILRHEIAHCNGWNH